jgi:hypothetical protein
MKKAEVLQKVSFCFAKTFAKSGHFGIEIQP